MTLAEAAAQAAELADQYAQGGLERELANLRSQWGDDIEAEARHADYRERAVGYRAIGQFRFRAKTELLRRGLEDESPSCRGSALVALERLSRDSPSVVNAVRPLLHKMVNADDNQAVRRLAIVCLKNGSAQRETITLLAGVSEDDRLDRDLRDVAGKVAASLKKKAGPKG